MSLQLSEDKQDLLLQRFCRGDKNKDIAEEFQISLTSVKRYKKSMKPLIDARKKLLVIPGVNDGVVDENKVDIRNVLTKKEHDYFSRIEKELNLYEDKEEGWVFHLTKSDQRVKQSGCWWSAIVYPDSAPAGWVDALRAQGFRIAISPLHDKDAWSHDSPEKVDPVTGDIIPKGAAYKMGDKKKAHWHVIIVVDKRTGYLEMNNIMQNICHCPYIQKCRSLRNAYDYFLHINAPEKYQSYNKDDIQTYNNFHVEPTKYEMNLISMEIIRLIQEHNLFEWASVVEFFQDDPELSLILSTRTAFFSSYVKARYYREHPVSTKYTEMKIVDKFSYEEEIQSDTE